MICEMRRSRAEKFSAFFPQMTGKRGHFSEQIRIRAQSSCEEKLILVNSVLFRVTLGVGLLIHWS